VATRYEKLAYTSLGFVQVTFALHLILIVDTA
jgi:hypothetical protein